MSPINGPESLRSPPDSEGYYGETDSDADVAAQDRQRKQKRRSPSNSPAKTLGRISPSHDDNSELSGSESTSDMSAYSQIQSWPIPNGTHGRVEKSLPGVARREVVYQPNGMEWPPQAEHSSENSDQSPSGAVEVDSGFQELPTVPLVSPKRAKEALMRTSYSQLVPMVGPVDNPVDEELTMTYMDKAKEASEYSTLYSLYQFINTSYVLYTILATNFRILRGEFCLHFFTLIYSGILPDKMTFSDKYTV